MKFKPSSAFKLKSGNTGSFKMMGSSPTKHGTTEDYQLGRNGHNPDTIESSHGDWHTDKIEAGKKVKADTPPKKNRSTHINRETGQKVYTDTGEPVVSPNKHIVPDDEQGRNHTNPHEKSKGGGNVSYVTYGKEDKKETETDNEEMIRSKRKAPKKKKDTMFRDSDNDGNAVSRAWKNRPKYKVRFNNSPMIPGFVSVKRK